MLCTLSPFTKLTLKILDDQTYYVEGNAAGEITDFNLWSYEMSEEELNFMTCGSKGNVVSWDSLKENGFAARTTRSFPQCNGIMFNLNILTSFLFIYRGCNNINII